MASYDAERRQLTWGEVNVAEVAVNNILFMKVYNGVENCTSVLRHYGEEKKCFGSKCEEIQTYRKE